MMNWAFVDSLRLNYFTGVCRQPNNYEIDIADRMQENSPYKWDRHKRDVGRALGKILQCERGEEGSNALSQKPKARARVASRLLIFRLMEHRTPLKMSVEGKKCVH